MDINKIYNENCLKTMSRMPNEFIDLIVTSPPYDDLREYKGYSFDFKAVAKELFRVIKNGGVVVWVVGDATLKGSETGSSFRQALYFKEIGFNLHDTMIYEKNSMSYPSKTRYTQIFEYMFIFSKGKPKTINIIKDKKNKWAGHQNWGEPSNRNKARKLVKTEKRTVAQFGSRNNIWRYNTGKGFSATDKIASKHPAIFPEKLANDHIISWSNEKEIIYDPFMGSGTTAKMAILNNRNYVGSDVSWEYLKIAILRINKATRGLK